jgi:hypothetical protein
VKDFKIWEGGGFVKSHKNSGGQNKIFPKINYEIVEVLTNITKYSKLFLPLHHIIILFKLKTSSKKNKQT